MTAILTEVHYLPDSWVGKAHTQQVSNQFSQIFPFKAVSNVKFLRKIQILYVKYILFSDKLKNLPQFQFIGHLMIRYVSMLNISRYFQFDRRYDFHPLKPHIF